MKKKYFVIGIVVILIIIIGLVIVLNQKTDGEKFSLEYTQVPTNNVFVYRDATEIIKILENGTGVVYLGFKECPWCQNYAKYLNEVAKEVGVDTIYYFDILEDRSNNTADYQKIVEILKDHLQYDEEGNPRIYVPNISFHIDGKIIGNDYETSKDTGGFEKPDEYWSEEKILSLKEKLTTYMEEVHTALNSCTNCNK